MAFIYESKLDAETAVQSADVPNGTFVERDHETGQWGWKEVLVDDAAKSHEPEVDPADLPAKAGDVVLQIGGPGARDLAAIEKLAKKLGFTIVVRDSLTFSEVERVKPGVKSARGPRSEGPTALQQIFIDMAMRENGASGHELLEAGATGDAKPGAFSFSQAVANIMKASGKWGTPMVFEIRDVAINRFKSEKRYYLKHVEVAEYDEAMAEWKAMEAEKKAAKAANGNAPMSDAAD